MRDRATGRARVSGAGTDEKGQPKDAPTMLNGEAGDGRAPILQ